VVRIGLAVALGLVLARGPVVRAADVGASELDRQQQLQARLAELIEQLGSPQFAVREKAHEQLRGLGLAAFDALLDAQQDKDIEIALRARYLLRGMPIQWVRETDPAAVQSMLRDYGQLGRDERLNRMQLLAGLENSQGIEALCRIARFETDFVLSKQAALQALGHHPPADAPRKEEVALIIRDCLGTSSRPAARWLRAYADTLVAPAEALTTWEQLTQEELDRFAKAPTQAPREVVRDLLRWHVDYLRELQHDDEATTKIHRVIGLVEPEYGDLSDVVDWSLEREAWFVPDELARRFPTEYMRYAYLIYRLAEARRGQGNAPGADEAAQRALQLDPDDFRVHTRRAAYLQTRQLYDWAEQEYRYVSQAGENHPDYALEAQEELSQMLFDLEREREAAEVLDAALALVKKNPATLGTLYPESELQSSRDYYLGVHYGKTQQRDQQRQHLERALENNPANIDIIIAMFRAEGDEAWRKQTAERLESSLGRIRGEMQQLQQSLLQTADPVGRDEINAAVAQKNNELAWLIGNTDGDFHEAIRCSQESLRLVPDSYAYLDTLGRCYYAAGDYEKAVQFQRQAVEGAPFLQQMRRQLQEFEQALAESRRRAE